MWKKLNSAIEMYSEPCLGNLKGETRFMALSIDKNSSPYLGIARQITKSQGSIDVPGFVDESKLILVKSENLLKWEKIHDLEIKHINDVIHEISSDNKYFIGLEDPDILTDEKGIKHVYFSIAFKLKQTQGYEVYLGHALGRTLDSLKATSPVLKPEINMFYPFFIC
jgi:hypothetical protein